MRIGRLIMEDLWEMARNRRLCCIYSYPYLRHVNCLYASFETKCCFRGEKHDGAVSQDHLHLCWIEAVAPMTVILLIVLCSSARLPACIPAST